MSSPGGNVNPASLQVLFRPVCPMPPAQCARMCIGCTIREQVREADRRRRESRLRFHAAVNTQLRRMGIEPMADPTFPQMRAELEAYPELRRELEAERMQRRYLIRVALRVQRVKGCSIRWDEASAQAAA
jgi:hypothetical protein